MDLEDLASFTVLARREHVTESAAHLGLSQPALSRRLAQLEHELGAPLFDREGRRLRLNRYGRIFDRSCRRILDEMADARRQIAELDDPSRGEIHLAYLSWLGSWLVPWLLKACRSAVPNARFLLHAGSYRDIERQLVDGTVDCILTTRQPAEGRAVWTLLRREPLYLAVPSSHPLATRAEVALLAAKEEPFIMPTVEVGLRGVIDRLCEGAGFVPRVIFESHELSTICGLVEAGLGVAIVHNDHRRVQPELVYVPLSDAGAVRNVGVAWLDDARAAPIVEQFRQAVLETRPSLL